MIDATTNSPIELIEHDSINCRRREVASYRDEFYRKLESHPDHLQDVELPAIFLNNEGKIQILVNHE